MLTYRLHIKVDKALTWLGYNSKLAELSTYFALRASIKAELNTNFFNTSFSFVITYVGSNLDKLVAGGHRVDD